MPKDTVAATSVTTGPLPSSRKVYIAGECHPELRVAMREIDLSSPDEPPLRVYDPSGPIPTPRRGSTSEAACPASERSGLARVAMSRNTMAVP